MRLFSLSVLLFFVCHDNLCGQSLKPIVFPSANSTLNGTSPSLIWTVGEAIVSVKENPNVRLYMGFIMPVTFVSTASQGSAKANTNLINESAENASDDGILIYPNPLGPGNVLHVRGRGLTEASTGIRIINSNGQSLEVDKLNLLSHQDEKELEVHLNLSSGFYLIQVPVANGLISGKLIIR